jgi:subtilase family serine protease
MALSLPLMWPGAAGAASAPVTHRLVRPCGVARGTTVVCDVVVNQKLVDGQVAAAAGSQAGYGPSDLTSAYGLAAAAATAGGTQTVAVVDAFNDPDAASDLARYRSYYSLPACTEASGCFRQVSQTGSSTALPADNASWAVEESLDIEMVSAICPNCHILLVESRRATIASLGTAVDEAVTLGATEVSNSYGGKEYSEEAAADHYYDHPGVAVTASNGDGGYGTSYPAASPDLVAVGGTTLTRSTGARGWAESVWGTSSGGEGTGSGCSEVEAKPAWQKHAGCSHRIIGDVAADADPSTGVAVYDSYQQSGWLEVGGTSVSSPVIASVFALAGNAASTGSGASYVYAHSHYGQTLNDVKSGSDGTCSPSFLCHAKVGYDAPSGLGTPEGTGAF